MRIDQRKIAKSEAQSFTQPFLNGLDDRISFAAIGTFVIAIFNEHDRRINRPLNVIAFGDWQGERAWRNAACFAFHFSTLLFCNSSSADRIPSAPGFTPTGET